MRKEHYSPFRRRADRIILSCIGPATRKRPHCLPPPAETRGTTRFPREFFARRYGLHEHALDTALVGPGDVVRHPGIAQHMLREFDDDVIGVRAGIVAKA
jgi:hypothetical protein